MKARTLALIAALVLMVGCGGRPLPQLPDVPAQVEVVDQDVHAGAAKALGILLAAARLANTISQIEDQAAREGAIPAPVDAGFDRAMVAYANASDVAVSRIQSGVSTWAELRAHVAPVLDRVEALTALAQQAGVIRDRVGSWLSTLRDIVMELVTGVTIGLTEQGFGGAQ